MRELIRDRPLATLVTLGSNGINANHIPLHLSLTPLNRLVFYEVTLLVQIQSGVIWNQILKCWLYSTDRTLTSVRLGT